MKKKLLLLLVAFPVLVSINVMLVYCCLEIQQGAYSDNLSIALNAVPIFLAIALDSTWLLLTIRQIKKHYKV